LGNIIIVFFSRIVLKIQGIAMPVPKRKRSRARRDKRFANKGLKVKTITKCANCQEPIAMHQACKSCGHYKGRKVLATKADRAVKRAEAHQAKKQAQQSTQEPTE
jgi:large subunit ribosomal protein L32